MISSLDLSNVVPMLSLYIKKKKEIIILQINTCSKSAAIETREREVKYVQG